MLERKGRVNCEAPDPSEMCFHAEDTRGGARAGLQWRVHKTRSVLVLLFINCCIAVQTNNGKPAFAPPCTGSWRSLGGGGEPTPLKD